jgi:sulfur carrier protein ThiS
MQIRVKLMGVLKANSPPGGVLDLPDGATVAAALTALNLPEKQIHLVMVNGQQERDRTRSLGPNDELMVLSPVAGGATSGAAD